MKNNKIAFFGIIFTLLMANFTNASGYQLYGVGVGSCGEWVSERKAGSWHSKGQWMLGVISAVGYYDIYSLKQTDSQAFAVWMDNYCQKNPINQFSDGVYALVKELTIVKP